VPDHELDALPKVPEPEVPELSIDFVNGFEPEPLRWQA
jgi:hypothetical protein